eukprot:TRINITY_DN14253_c0_g4_i1.p1 TRINITY_DN14253_c0_g4~~TRINITY_DN14253_c0_g4_i1.p1  ORF type:complete len:479 (-),score=98.65 TRINITY_DN14253_c0_g4_i1:54-1490(-)
MAAPAAGPRVMRGGGRGAWVAGAGGAWADAGCFTANAFAEGPKASAEHPSARGHGGSMANTGGFVESAVGGFVGGQLPKAWAEDARPVPARRRRPSPLPAADECLRSTAASSGDCSDASPKVATGSGGGRLWNAFRELCRENRVPGQSLFIDAWNSRLSPNRNRRTDVAAPRTREMSRLGVPQAGSFAEAGQVCEAPSPGSCPRTRTMVMWLNAFSDHSGGETPSTRATGSTFATTPATHASATPSRPDPSGSRSLPHLVASPHLGGGRGRAAPADVSRLSFFSNDVSERSSPAGGDACGFEFGFGGGSNVRGRRRCGCSRTGAAADGCSGRSCDCTEFGAAVDANSSGATDARACVDGGGGGWGGGWVGSARIGSSLPGADAGEFEFGFGDGPNARGRRRCGCRGTGAVADASSRRSCDCTEPGAGVDASGPGAAGARACFDGGGSGWGGGWVGGARIGRSWRTSDNGQDLRNSTIY